MSPSPPPTADDLPQRYGLAFLTDQWEWRDELEAESFEAAKAGARAALEAVVRDERPELACVTLLSGDVRVGVWDWIAAKPYWTPLR